MKKTKWLLIANSTIARFYIKEIITDELGQKKHRLRLINELSHPESRQKKQDLVTDRAGQYKSGGGAGDFESSDPKSVEVERFAIEIANTLDHAYNTRQYKELVLVAPASLQGLIEKHATKHVKESIKEILHKDYVNMSEPELYSILYGDK